MTTATEPTATTYRVPQENVELLAERLAELNKRARKLNVPEARLIPHGTEVEHCIKENIFGQKIEYDRTFCLFTIEGETPKLSATWNKRSIARSAKPRCSTSTRAKSESVKTST